MQCCARVTAYWSMLEMLLCRSWTEARTVGLLLERDADANGLRGRAPSMRSRRSGLQGLAHRLLWPFVFKADATRGVVSLRETRALCASL
eukprot:6198694-Pleurochrysis_carterae.AAC.1